MSSMKRIVGGQLSDTPATGSPAPGVLIMRNLSVEFTNLHQEYSLPSPQNSIYIPPQSFPSHIISFSVLNTQ